MKPYIYLPIFLAAFGLNLNAATVAISTSTPTIDGDDISNLAAATGSDNIWSDRKIIGQTFLTDGAGTSDLNSFTFQLTEGDGTILGWKDYRVRVGTISAGTFTPFFDEITRSPDSDTPDLSFFTYQFTTPIALAANTTYAIDVGMSGSQNGFATGISSVTKSGNNYANGQFYSTNGNQNSYANLATSPISFSAGNDMVFALDMTVVPEPSVIGLVGLSGLFLLRRRRA